jgi:hypothetical protein
LVIGLGEKVNLINEDIASQVIRDIKPGIGLSDNLVMEEQDG